MNLEPNRASAVSTTALAISGSAMSPSTRARRSDASISADWPTQGHGSYRSPISQPRSKARPADALVAMELCLIGSIRRYGQIV
jgi:hypothetical protein